MRHSFDWTIERDDGTSFEVYVEGTYRFGAPEQGPTYSSGGEPAEPDEFEITAIYGLPDGISLTDKEEEAICDYAYENPPEDDDYEEYD